MDLLPKDTISETEFVIRIHKTDTPTFEFVDLPGNKGQAFIHLGSYKYAVILFL